MVVYIHYGDEEQDPTLQGAEWLQAVIEQQQGADAARAFYDRFVAIRNDSNDYDIVAVFDLFVKHGKDLFAAIPETSSRGEDRLKEVESFFALVLSMLMQFDDGAALDESTESLCKLFGENVEQQPELRLRMLMMLYNTFNNPAMSHRFRVFKHILNYSSKAGLFETQVMPYLDYLDDWMADWQDAANGMTLEDKRKLFLDLSECLRKLGQGKRVDAFLYLKRYAQLYQGEKDKALSEKQVQDATVQLLKDALQLSSVIQFDDILAFDTVQALEKTKNKQLVELCRLFLNGDVKDLDNFHKKNKAMFEEHNLDFVAAMAKMRLLTLATKVHGKSEISLEEVAKALDEDEENIQQWVVTAVSEGVIDGRIDQLGRKVLVKSAFQREFGKKEWAFLDSKLTQWTDNLENIIKFLGEQKQMRESTVGGA